jgi:cytochrome c biogenesis protein CcdA/thiol-disulfide isomerase/thioredoxin
VLTLALIGFVGGLITGISPCVLPVLPVIFFSGGSASARDEVKAKSPFTGSRPYLVILGLVISFSVFTLVGSLLLSLLHLPQDVIRWVGLAVLVLLGIGLIVPAFERILEKPFQWIPQRAVSNDRGGFVLGLALGAVYVPCAGPVLAAITVAGATGKIGAGTILLTAAFAIGTGLPLLIFALAGRGVAERVKAFRSHQRGIRITAGVVMIALAVALTFDLPDVLQRLIPDYTSTLQQAAGGTDVLGGAPLAAGESGTSNGSGAAPTKAATKPGSDPFASDPSCAAEVSTLVDCGEAPAIAGITAWLNTPNGSALKLSALRGKVVLIDFWAYSCINCQRAAPHVNAWYASYKDDGLEVIGLHAPEYAFEHDESNVVAGAARLGIKYPIALDNNFTTWTAYSNQYWPAEYLIDSSGIVRHVSFGEGGYSTTEKLIRQLLQAADPGVRLPKATDVADTTPTNANQSPETYLGSEKVATTSFAGGGTYADGESTFTVPKSLPSNTFALGGTWKIGEESLSPVGVGTLALDYNAAHVYLDIGGTGTLKVTDAAGTRTINVSGAPNIYDLAAPGRKAGHGTMSIDLSSGLEAYSFTFG